VAIIRLSKSPSWGLVVVCISVGRSIQKLSFKTFAEIPFPEFNLEWPTRGLTANLQGMETDRSEKSGRWFQNR
jgi:hypothetical protein